MSKVRQYVTVYGRGIDTTRWFRDLKMAGVPQTGDKVSIDPDETYVLDVDWFIYTFDGSAEIYLEGISIDPPEGHRCKQVWKTEHDGDIAQWLAGNGWQAWSSK